jgi:hypothetical protein
MNDFFEDDLIHSLFVPPPPPQMYYIRYRYPNQPGSESTKGPGEEKKAAETSGKESVEGTKAAESTASEPQPESQPSTGPTGPTGPASPAAPETPTTPAEEKPGEKSEAEAAAEAAAKAEAGTENKPAEEGSGASRGSESQEKGETKAKESSEDEFEEGEEYTSYRRTIFRGSNGLVHSIVEEQNGKTGEVKVTEERRIGERSMTLQRVLDSKGAVQNEFETHENIGEDEESLQKFKDDWLKFAPQRNRSLKQ